MSWKSSSSCQSKDGLRFRWNRLVVSATLQRKCILLGKVPHITSDKSHLLSFPHDKYLIYQCIKWHCCYELNIIILAAMLHRKHRHFSDYKRCNCICKANAVCVCVFWKVACVPPWSDRRVMSQRVADRVQLGGVEPRRGDKSMLLDSRLHSHVFSEAPMFSASTDRPF